MKLISTRNGQVIAGISGFALVLIALIWINLWRQLENDKKETIAVAVQRNANLAVALEQYAIRTIHNADAVLQLVKIEYEVKNTIDFEGLINSRIIDNSFFNGVAIMNEKGELVAVNLKAASDTVINFSDRDYFRFHQKETGNLLHISKPVISRTLGKAVIIISRRLQNEDGSFGGVVAVQVEPHNFTRFYADANLRKHDLISLISPDGITYARRTGAIESYGEDISKSPLFSYVAKKGVDNYAAKDAIRGIYTHFSYRKLKDHDMIATVGSAETDILSDFEGRKRRDLFMVVIITSLLIVFSALVIYLFTQRKKTLEKIRESEVKYRSIFENSKDAILLITPKGKLKGVNPATCEIFRMSLNEILEKSFGQLADKGQLHLKELAAESELSKTIEGECNFLRGDGTKFIGECSSTMQLDAEGNKEHILIIRDITEKKQAEEKNVSDQKRFQRKLTRQIILAQEREREIIGHELHDNVNQILTTVKLYIELASTNPNMRDELLPKSIHHIKDCISEIRNLSRELSAPTLGTQSLIDSIKALIETVQSSSGLVIHLNHEGYLQQLHKDQKLAIYRIAQEQLNNVIKHAQATEVWMTLEQKNGNTHLSIRDNGRGFDPSVKANGIGINNMQSRTKAFGGMLQIVSSPGQGCNVVISLPIQKDSGEEE